MDAFLKFFGYLYLLHGSVAFIAGLLALSSAVFDGMIYLFSGGILLKATRYFSTFSSKFILASLIISPFAIFITGFLCGDTRFQNPFIILRFVLFIIPILSLLVIFIFANSFFAYCKLSFLYKTFVLVFCYSLLIVWGHELFLTYENIYFRGMMISVIPVYVIFFVVYFFQKRKRLIGRFQGSVQKWVKRVRRRTWTLIVDILTKKNIYESKKKLPSPNLAQQKHNHEYE